jgi:hypothetical protein
MAKNGTQLAHRIVYTIIETPQGIVAAPIITDAGNTRFFVALTKGDHRHLDEIVAAAAHVPITMSGLRHQIKYEIPRARIYTSYTAVKTYEEH